MLSRYVIPFVLAMLAVLSIAFVGYSLADEVPLFRYAVLSHGRCDAAVRYEIASDGSVGDVTLLRADESRICNESLIAFVRGEPRSPDPDGRQRRVTMVWSSSPFLCAVGREPGGEVIQRTKALKDPEEESANPVQLAANAWPDLKLLGAHTHPGGQMCLLSSTVDSRKAPAQSARCVEGCSVADEEQALRNAGLSHGDCDAAVRFEIEPDGSVREVTLLRADETAICNETLMAYARQGRWSSDPEGRHRSKTLGWSSVPRSATEAEFHTYPGAVGLDTGGRFLLAHRDSHVDLTQLAARYSPLGPFETIEEFRSEGPLLCAIGRDPSGEAVMRTEALARPLEEGADMDPFVQAAAIWPDLELLGAHAHGAGGSCFLLQSTVPSRKGGGR